MSPASFRFCRRLPLHRLAIDDFVCRLFSRRSRSSGFSNRSVSLFLNDSRHDTAVTALLRQKDTEPTLRLSTGDAEDVRNAQRHRCSFHAIA